MMVKGTWPKSSIEKVYKKAETTPRESQTPPVYEEIILRNGQNRSGKKDGSTILTRYP